ncbi:peptidase S1, partial [Micromonospora sp. S4605]
MTFSQPSGRFQAGRRAPGQGGDMTEYESDPQRRPAPTDAEPSHPTAELPHVERAQSDSPTIEAGPA